jgi:hypothetical protein
MALHWHIESREKLFVVIADGNVELEEAEQMLDAVVCSGATGYRKLFDGMLGETRMTASELLTLGVRIRALHAGDTPFGPVAIALPHDKRPPLMRLMGIMAAARRPLRIFNDVESAHGWLSLFGGSGRDDLKRTETGSTFHRTLQRAGGAMKRRAASVTSRN